MAQKLIDIEIIGRQINILGSLSLKLQVAKNFDYIGNQEIIIYDSAKVFHYVFANSYTNKEQERHISKLFFLQYEYFLPSIKKSYKYDSMDILELGGILWHRDNFIDRTTHDDWEPNSDVYQLITFIEKKDYIFPPKVFTNRLVTMLNEEKNQELLILYLEKIEEDKWKKFSLNGQIIEHQWQKEQIHLQKRVLSSFTIL